MTTQENFTKAIQFIKQHQDGEVAELLRFRGLNYNMIYGVSQQIMSKFAEKIGRNQELASMLWKENFREAKLMALMISEPACISNEEVETLIAGCTNHEMVEIGTFYLFSKLPHVLEKVYEWIQSDKEFYKMAAYTMIAQSAKHNMSFIDVEKLTPFYKQDFTNPSYFVRKSLINAFQELAFRKPGLKQPIIKATKYILERNKGSEFELQAKDMLQVLNYC
ncbi:MAG: DNA alkylation repair protein [Bacteroidales bacterium]|jgi:3-methyladenine DNA glycosylase AlkD|nr:DNA alkylation repair protein [Bacteroidales bacterium]